MNPLAIQLCGTGSRASRLLGHITKKNAERRVLRSAPVMRGKS